MSTSTPTKLPVAPTVCITVEVTEDQALAYAQFLKRAGFSDYMGCAVDTDEAYLMVSAGEKIRAAFESAGYSPR